MAMSRQPPTTPPTLPESRSIAIAVDRSVHAVRAQREAKNLSESIGLDQEYIGRAQTLTAELATNLIAHAGHGVLVLSATRIGSHRQLDVIAIDRAGGIVDEQGNLAVERALQDGYSTSGTAGLGLGAVERLSTRFDLVSAPGRGTIVWSQLTPGPPLPLAGDLDVAAIRLPYPGLDVCGDGWAWLPRANGVAALLVDGLGHGPGAAEAANRAQEAFYRVGDHEPVAILEAIHKALRSTRGAAGAVIAIDAVEGTMRYAGAGNIAGMLCTRQTSHSLTWPFGTLGMRVSRFVEGELPWTRASTLVLHSDGVRNHWAEDRKEILDHQRPAISAGILLRDHRRDRDDACALVIKCIDESRTAIPRENSEEID